jgi:hypothetical protein
MGVDQDKSGEIVHLEATPVTMDLKKIKKILLLLGGEFRRFNTLSFSYHVPTTSAFFLKVLNLRNSPPNSSRIFLIFLIKSLLKSLGHSCPQGISKEI